MSTPLPPDDKISRDALALHREALVFDLHADTLIPMRAWGYRIERRHRFRMPGSRFFWHCDLPRFREGGVDAQFFGVVTPPWPRGSRLTAALRQTKIMAETATRLCGQMRLVRSAKELLRCRAEGILAALLGVEGAHVLQGDPGNVAVLAKAGVRYLGLAHFTSNEIAPAAKGAGADNQAPLPPLGREVIAELKRTGVLLDLAHVGRRAFLEAAEQHAAPFLVSHTGISGAYQHWRNLDDEQLRAVAEYDGVVGIIFASGYLAPPGRRALPALLAHFEHVRRTIGARHLALGSDYDGFIRPLPEIPNVAHLPRVTDLLLRSGWREDEIRGVLGQNALRVLSALPPRNTCED